MNEEIIKIKLSAMAEVENIEKFDVLGIDRITNKNAKASIPQLIKPSLDAASAANEAAMRVEMLLKYIDEVPEVFGYRYLTGQADDRVEAVNDMPYDSTGMAPEGSKRASLLQKLRPYQCNHDGSEREYLQDDVRLTAGYSPSRLTDPIKLQMVRVPHFFYRSFEMDGHRYVLFCEQAPEVMGSPMDMTGWKEVKPYGAPRYQGRVVDFGGVKKLCSFSGEYPTVSTSLTNFVTYARNVSPKACVMPYYLYEPLAFLMILELGRHDAQVHYLGITNAGASYANAAKNGVTDSLVTPSGEVQVEYEPGKFTKQFRWRFMEGFYGQIWKLLSGIYYRWEPGWEKIKVFIAQGIDVINTSNNFSQYALLGETPKANGYIKEFIPGTVIADELGGSTTTYKCDYSSCYYTAVNAFTHSAIVGGNSFNGRNAGPFFFASTVDVGSAYVYIGASLVMTD